MYVVKYFIFEFQKKLFHGEPILGGSKLKVTGLTNTLIQLLVAILLMSNVNLAQNCQSV